MTAVTVQPWMSTGRAVGGTVGVSWCGRGLRPVAGTPSPDWGISGVETKSGSSCGPGQAKLR